MSNESSPAHERMMSEDTQRNKMLQSSNPRNKTSRSRGRNSASHRHTNSNSAEKGTNNHIYGKVATLAPFRDDTEMMEYQCESSDNGGDYDDDLE